MNRSPKVVLGVVLAAATLLLLASPASARHPSLRGTQINVLVGPPVENFAARSAEEKREFLDDQVWRFELYVDGVRLPLRRGLHEVLNPFCDCISLNKFHFVQFDANQFAPGTYTFEGRWYADNDDDDVSELEILSVRTVVFT
jgi:hypothetical protein